VKDCQRESGEVMLYGRELRVKLGKLLEQVGTDAVSQVLKEFWPDVKHRLFQHHNETPDPGSR
jgi:hypothetical protein